jgi:UDP-GlcNAc3NAcA epimerase
LKKIVTVLGARPQFIKASVVSHEMRRRSDLTEIVVHTGQHFDRNMSDVFFAELGMDPPAYFLDIHGGSHGAMTGRMLAEVEQVLLKEEPDAVLVYGDTNSTIAGSLAAVKLHIPARRGRLAKLQSGDAGGGQSHSDGPHFPLALHAHIGRGGSSAARRIR